MESKTATTLLDEHQKTEPAYSESTTPPKSFEKEEEFKQYSKDASQNSLAGEGTEPANAAEPEGEWVEGTKLFMVITSLTFGSLLMLLDTSIVSTVSFLEEIRRIYLGGYTNQNTGYPSYHYSIPLFGRCWLVWSFLPTLKRCPSATDWKVLSSFWRESKFEHLNILIAEN